jgi:hypothetical protein
MNVPWSVNRSFILFIFPLSLLVSLISLFKKKALDAHKRKILLILTITALFELKSAFIRSDEGHIIAGIYPSVLVLFTMLFFLFKKNINPVLATLALILYLLIPYKGAYYLNFSVRNLKAIVSALEPTKTFADIYRFAPDYYYKPDDFKYFSSLIAKNPGSVMVFPYENYLLNAYGETYNTFALQFYEYSASLVEEIAMERLRKSPPKYIILGIDTKSALSIDDIPNFSRNPLIAKWILGNYSVYENKGRYLILHFQPRKSLSKRESPACDLYDIDVRDIGKSSFLEATTKPSTFYVKGRKNVRLPIGKETQKVFIVEAFNDPEKLGLLMREKFNFTNQRSRLKKLIIVKKYPLSWIQDTIERNFSITCY